MGGLPSKTDTSRQTLAFEREAYRSSPIAVTSRWLDRVWSRGLSRFGDQRRRMRESCVVDQRESRSVALGGHRLGLADHDPRAWNSPYRSWSASGWTAGGERARWLRFPARSWALCFSCSTRFGWRKSCLGRDRTAARRTRRAARRELTQTNSGGPTLMPRPDRRSPPLPVLGPENNLHRSRIGWLVQNTMAGHSENPLSHVVDHDTIEMPWWNPPTFESEIHLPKILGAFRSRGSW